MTASPIQTSQFSRRQFSARIGLSTLGLTLPQLLRADERAAASKKADACILLWMSGGPPQHETFDPKPEAPAEIRGEFQPIPTSIPGVQFCELLPELAKRAKDLSVLRATSTRNNAHSSSGYWMLTGREHPRGAIEVAGQQSPEDWPCIGGVIRHLVKDKAGLPSSVTLPEAIYNDPRDYWPGQDGGFLGRSNDPWFMKCDPSEPGFHIEELQTPPDVGPDRFVSRLALLEQVERMKQGDRFTQQAVELITSPLVRRAFDLRDEPDALKAKYGQHKFGQSCLLARRLVEAGVKLVQVNWPREKGDNMTGFPVWDTHRNNNARVRDVLCPPMDRAFAALIDDLKDRGLFERTLVVWMGEFGRSPRFNAMAGRDHWGNVFCTALAGGGMKGGYIHGASDRFGAEPKDGIVSPPDLQATIYHALGISPQTEIHDPLGRPFTLTTGRVISELFA